MSYKCTNCGQEFELWSSAFLMVHDCIDGFRPANEKIIKKDMQLEKHKDKRGVIEDLYVGKDFSVTRITFKKGAIRGNHYHKKTVQYDIVVDGKLEVYRNAGFDCNLTESEAAFHGEFEAHAYKALKDSEMISICIGKRIGKNYSKDTYKLETPLV